MVSIEALKIIRQEYAECIKAVKELESEWINDKRSRTKKGKYEFAAAQEIELFEICGKLGIELWDDDLKLIPA